MKKRITHLIAVAHTQWQIGLSFLGMVILCIYWRSWKDIPHLLYDIPSGFIMSAFIAQLICQACTGDFSPKWWGRLTAMIPMSIVPTGREFLDWQISGHLTDMLAVALIQGLDRECSVWERIGYSIPLPIVLYIRLTIFDQPGHMETISAICVGTFIFFLAKGGEIYANWRTQ